MDNSRQKDTRQNLTLRILQFSIFLVEKFKGNKVAVFHSLNPCPSIVLDRSFWLEFKGNPNRYQNTKLFTKLRNSNLLIESDKVDKRELKRARQLLSSRIPNSPSTLYLILTEKCNLQCKYCPFSKFKSSKKQPRSMSYPIAEKGINFWVETLNSSLESNRTYNIIFYGGEPLLNIGVLKKSLEYIQFLESKNKLPLNLRVLLDTNGVLLTKKLALFLKRHKVEVTIALDEFSPINDLYRVDFKKQGTVGKVLEVLKMLKNLKIPVHLSIALTPQNLSKIKNFPEYMKTYGIGSFGINIIRGYSFFQGYQKKAAEIMRDFFWSTKQKEIIEFQTYRRFLAFNSKNFHSCYCGGFGEHVVVHPGGEIGHCPWTSGYLQGNVLNDRNYSSIRKKNFFFTRRRDLPLYKKECLGCRAISICGGKCIWAEDQSKGKDKSFCQLSQVLFDSFIWKYGVKLKDEKRTS